MSRRLLLIAAALLAFGASLAHGFHYDDYSVVTGASWHDGQTRPLTWLTFLLNASFHSSPLVWHLVNIAAHVAAVLLLYEVLLLLIPAGALLGAAIFAVHPIQAEAVAYVFSRATLFSTALSLLACLLWLRGRRWWAVACFVPALLAKEDCVTIPLFLLWIDYARGRWQAASMLGCAFLAGMRTLLATHAAGSNAGFTAGIGPLNYGLAQGYVILRYLRLFIVPFGFTIDPEIQPSIAVAVMCWLAVPTLALVALRPSWGRWLIGGLILLIPSASVFPAADLAADHRMYLPMIAFAALAGLLLARLSSIAGWTVVAVLIAVSITRMWVWSSDERLWTEAVLRAPDKVRPKIQLSRAVAPERALAILQEAPQDDRAVQAEQGRVYLELGQPRMAFTQFGKVLALTPGDVHAINNRGVALRAMGQEEAARADFERALKTEPCFVDARKNLGLELCP